MDRWPRGEIDAWIALFVCAHIADQGEKTPFRIICKQCANIGAQQMPVGFGNEHAFDMRVFIHIGRISPAIEKGEYIVGQVVIDKPRQLKPAKSKVSPVACWISSE